MGLPIVGPGGRAIANSHQPGDEGVANARLIAAAPDLLAALRLMLADHDAACTGPDCPFNSIDLARAALAKATTS